MLVLEGTKQPSQATQGAPWCPRPLKIQRLVIGPSYTRMCSPYTLILLVEVFPSSTSKMSLKNKKPMVVSIQGTSSESGERALHNTELSATSCSYFVSQCIVYKAWICISNISVNGTDKKSASWSLCRGGNKISKMQANGSAFKLGPCCGERGENTVREKAASVETSPSSVCT